MELLFDEFVPILNVEVALDGSLHSAATEVVDWSISVPSAIF